MCYFEHGLLLRIVVSLDVAESEWFHGAVLRASDHGLVIRSECENINKCRENEERQRKTKREDN